MARKVMKETWYTFDPANRIITFPKYVPHEHLILVTDITANKVLYNFSDPSLGYSGYTSVVNNDGTELTTLTLKYNTASLASNDEIQVIFDEYVEQFTGSEEMLDNVGKMKTSSPQALIDTDFEYGAQSSKWEALSTINHRPTSYGYSYSNLNIASVTTGIATSKTVTVAVNTTTATVTAASANLALGQATYTAAAHGFSVGQYVTITGAGTAAFNVTAAQIIAVPSANTFVINSSNATTSGAAVSFTSGSAVAGVVPPVGSFINVIDSYYTGVNGRYTVETRASESSFTYTAKYAPGATWASTNVFDTNKTLILQEGLYSNAAIGTNGVNTVPTISYTSQTGGSPVTVTTSVPHGLSIGNEIAVVGTSGVTGTNGSFAVSTIVNSNQFVYYTPSTLTGTLAVTGTATASVGSGAVGITGSNLLAIGAITGAVSAGMAVSGVGIPSGTFVTNIVTGSGATTSLVTLSQPFFAAATATTYTFTAAIYARPQGQVQHRAFDGGVLFQTNAGSNNQSLSRQTRRYFRYQSGKAISMSSGTILKPTLNIDSLTASGTAISSTVTVITKERHNLQPGYQVTIYGSTDSGYNGVFTVTSILGPQTFTYANTSVLASTSATGTPYVSTTAWYGAQTRLGIFDNQNGAYWEFDGQNVYAVRRSSTYQIQGRVGIAQGSTTVVSTSQNTTAFSKQLSVGDWIVIRGQSYKVQDIASDTQMTISPAYRGVNSIPTSLATPLTTTITGTQGQLTITVGANTGLFNGMLVTGTGIAQGAVITGISGTTVTLSIANSGTPSGNGTFTGTNMVYVTKTVNTKIKQSNFNIDQLDGHGPTGYNLDLSKMQMFFVDYSWYGAGSIRWGLRTNRGNIMWVHRMPNNNANATAYMRSGNLPARYESSTYPVSTYVTSSILAADTTINVADTSSFPTSGTLVIRPGNSAATGSGGNNTGVYEFINYTGTTSTSFTGVTRAAAGATTATVSATAGTNTATVSSATGLQIGQRVINTAYPEGTFISAIAGTNLTLSNAATNTIATSATIFPPLASTAQGYSYQSTAPISVELAYPTYGPGLSHWGTSVIIDGRFDDDKSLLFTYGQTNATTLAPAGGTTAVGTGTTTAITLSAANANIVPGMLVSGTGILDGTYVVSIASTALVISQAPLTGGITSATLTFYGSASKALLSIRVAPSVDNGLTSPFGARELINRMQLQLKTLDISLLNTATGNVLVQAYLNGTPIASPAASTALAATTWTNAIKNAALTPNSSLAQIADYAGANVSISGGEVTGGFFVNSTGTSDISQVRDLGNAVLGGGYSSSNTGIYPDGPDTLTLVVTNLSSAPVSVLGRVSWTEAQA